MGIQKSQFLQQNSKIPVFTTEFKNSSFYNRIQKSQFLQQNSKIQHETFFGRHMGSTNCANKTNSI